MMYMAGHVIGAQSFMARGDSRQSRISYERMNVLFMTDRRFRSRHFI
jgi:hypothetical protein